jgi:hypothetical protein
MPGIKEKTVSAFNNYPIFLFLLPVFFIYSGYNELFGFLSFKFVLQNFICIIASTLIVYILSLATLKNKRNAAVFTFLIILICLTFGFLFDSIKKITSIPLLSRYVFLLPALLVVFTCLFIILRKKQLSTGFYTFLNLLFVVLILSEIPNSIRRYQLDKSVRNLIDFRLSVANEYSPAKTLVDSSKPDIYFLVFDAMAASKSVSLTTGKSISDLDTFLTGKGFYLATDAKANYNWTIHSLSTTLNMEYLPPWIAPVMDDLKVYFWGSSSFKDNSLFRILAQENYTINSFQPISFDNKQWPGDPYFHNLKKYHYYFKTLPGRFYRDIFWNYSRINIEFIHKRQLALLNKRNQQKKQYFDTTVALIKKSCGNTNFPKFTYGHFMLPHDPYVFDSTGKLKEPLQTVVRTTQDDLEGYYQQLRYTTNVIRDLVTYIQANNKKNTIIIVAGDHGFKTKEARINGYTFNNYSAFYFPDGDYSTLYKSASPVNSFRFVLNKYFHANLPLLKDSSTLVVPEKREAMRMSELENKKQ